MRCCFGDLTGVPYGLLRGLRDLGYQQSRDPQLLIVFHPGQYTVPVWYIPLPDRPLTQNQYTGYLRNLLDGSKPRIGNPGFHPTLPQAAGVVD